MSKPDTTLKPQFHTQDAQILNKVRAYAGFFHIDCYQLRHQLFAGQWSTPLNREVFERGDAAAVLPYDPQQDAVVLLEQFRVGALRDENSPWLIEIVAGMINAPVETPLQVIHREAKEEVGLQLGRVVPICHYWVSPGGCSERMYLFCAEVNATLAPAFAGVSAEHEDIRVHVVPRQQAIDAVTTGAVNNATTIIALQWLALHGQALRDEWLSGSGA